MIWKKILGDEKYSASNTGLIRNDATMKILKGTKTMGTYERVSLGHGNHRRVHRLVLTAFSGACPDGMQACHNDGNKLNNNSSNLRWDTRSSNQMDKVRHGTHNKGEKNNMARINDEAVKVIRWMYQSGKNQNDLAKAYRVSQSMISKIVMNKRWKHIQLKEAI